MIARVQRDWRSRQDLSDWREWTKPQRHLSKRLTAISSFHLRAYESTSDEARAIREAQRRVVGYPSQRVRGCGFGTFLYLPRVARFGRFLA